MAFNNNLIGGYCDPCATNQFTTPLQYSLDYKGVTYVGVQLNTTGATTSFSPLTFHVRLPLNPNGTSQPFVVGTATLTFFNSAGVALNAPYALSATQQNDQQGFAQLVASFTAAALTPIPASTVYAVLAYTIVNEYGNNQTLKTYSHVFTPSICLGPPTFLSVCFGTNWIAEIPCPPNFCIDTVVLQTNLNGGGWTTVGTFNADGELSGVITLPTGQSAAFAAWDSTNNKVIIQFLPGLSCTLDLVRININAGTTLIPATLVQSLPQVV